MPELDRISLSSNFAGGAGINFRRKSPNHFAWNVPADPPSTRLAKGYDYFFCVRVVNLDVRPREITLDVLRPERQAEPQWSPSQVPLFVSKDMRSWYVLDEVKAGPGHMEFRAKLALAAGQGIYVSNSLPYPAEWMNEWLRQTATAYPDLTTLQIIGQSAQECPVWLLTLTDPSVLESDKDRVLITSGFHPAEPDWLATMAIIETLLSDNVWSQQVRREFIIDVVVQVNPDGFDLGTNGCNANGINLYWDFRPDDPETCPEAAHLWRWIESHPPCLYMDFHAYVHQLHKDFRPYIRPLSDYAPSAWPVVRAIDRQLIGLCNGRSAR